MKQIITSMYFQLSVNIIGLPVYFQQKKILTEQTASSRFFKSKLPLLVEFKTIIN